MTDSQLLAELRSEVNAAFSSLSQYLALVITNNPGASVVTAFKRPDVEAVLADALAAAVAAAQAVVAQAWEDNLGLGNDPVLGRLLADVARAYRAAHLRGLLRTAYLSVPHRVFIPGQSKPGSNPGMEAAAERAAAVAAAIARFTHQATFRNALSVDIAAGHARTASQLAGAAPGQYKRWRAHVEKPTCCHWCRLLNGVTIPVHEDFASHLGGPADLTGHGHLTKPPLPYLGKLPGPKLHPSCECHLEIVNAPEPEGVPPDGSQEPVPSTRAGFLAAADIRAMPEPKYRSLMAFLRAAVHELGQLLRRLATRE